MLTYLLRDASPRLRYGLWMLVLVKAILPPTIAAFWGVGAWGVAPVVEYDWPVVAAENGAASSIEALSAASDNNVPVALETAASFSAEGPLLIVWAAGCLLLWVAVAWRYRRLIRLTHSMRRIDEGPARIELERLASHFSLKTVPELYETEQATSPMLVGVLRPKIVLPESVLTRLGPDELRMVLAHELVHWRRYDTWVGWVQVFVQGVFWFHPLVWLANARIRHERECACDETVLREGRCDSEGYGETIIRVLTASRGRSLVMANMVGVFERGSSLQTRLEEIMSFDPTRRRFNWLSRIALVAAALVLLPMAIPDVQADNASDPSVATPPPTRGTENAPESRPKTNWPTIVSTTPKIGATDVDPNINAISVTFDRDMDVGGYSWTGSGEFHPPTPEGVTPVWIDKRTCELPVRLKKAWYYRVGINSTSHQNFRSELGVPVPTSAIYFCTAGAPRAMSVRVRVPKVVKMLPENGATDVDPGLKMIRVTFDMPMSIGSHSWTGGGPTFPTIPDGKTPRWSPDGKSAMLPVELKPGTKYELGLNSVHHKNFGSKWGVSLEPVVYRFQTRPANQ